MPRVPNVFIGMPVFNGDRYLVQAIESVLSQSFEDFELFISDNASTDSTWEICRSYAQKDHRVRLHRNPVNMGALKNFDLVFREAAAPYFMWMAHDDVLHPRYVEACFDFLRLHSDYVLCYTANDTIDPEGKPFAHFEDSACEVNSDDKVTRFAQCAAKLYPSVPIYGLIRTDALAKTRKFPQSQLPHAQDYVLLLELSLLGKFHHIPETLRSYRIKTGTGLKNSDPHDIMVRQSLAMSGRARVPILPSVRCSMRMLSIALKPECAPLQSLKLASIIVRNKLFLSLWYRDFIMLEKLITYRFPALHECLGKINRKFLAWVIKRFNVPMKVDPSLL